MNHSTIDQSLKVNKEEGWTVIEIVSEAEVSDCLTRTFGSMPWKVSDSSESLY